MQRHVPATIACLAFAAAASAQSTAFTYQGRLKNGTQAASGLHDFRFRLFNAATGGTQVGSTQCADNVGVSAGLFTTTVDFGQQYDTPAQRFLEIEVRADTGLNCGSPGGFVVLAPRQPLTATPMASHARSAFSLAASDGSPANAVFVDNTGNVGVGTTAPEAKLHLAGVQNGVRVDGPGIGAANASWVEFRDAAGARTGYVGDGSGSDLGTYLVSDAGDVHLYTAVGAALTAKPVGNVGIGTTTPQARLDVRGDIRLGNSGQYSAAGGQEQLRIVRGKVTDDGSILAGLGFSVARTSVGQYTITFNPPFAGTPTTVASPDIILPSTNFNHVWIDSVNSGQVNVILTSQAGGVQDGQFHFIATGPR